MLPCCGFNIYQESDKETVWISGCPNGKDWEVAHTEDNEEVIIILDDDTTIYVPIEKYKEEVFRFADEIEKFYLSCTPKILPDDEEDKNGYLTFWKEWHNRRKA